MISLNERQINLAKLLSVENDYRPASFYSKKLSVSTKTIYQDLEILKEELKTFEIKIERLPSAGIQMIGQSSDIQNFFSSIDENKDLYSPENRRIKIVKEVLFGQSKPTLELLSQKFIVSKTSLYNDLKVLNKLIDSEQVEIISTQEGLQVTGDEAAIQKAIKQLVFHYAVNVSPNNFRQVLNVFFDHDIIDAVYSLLMEDYSELTEKVSDYYVRSLFASLTIQCNRLRSDKHVKSEENFLFNSIKYMETYIVANGLVEELSNQLSIDFTEEDKEYLCRQLFAHRLTNSMKISNEDYSEIVTKLIERMSEIEKIDLTKNEHLYKSLLYHIPAMILRLKKGIRIQNPLMESIKEQYSELFSIVWYALVILEKEYDVILNDDEISLVLIHFQIALESQSKANNILIICQYGISSAQYIYSKVRRFIPARDNVEISTLDKFNTADSQDIDLIISSLDFDSGSTPYVRVTPLVNKEDYVKIMEAYTNTIIQSEKRIEENDLMDRLNVPTMMKFLDESLVKTRVEVESKEECFDMLISELEDRKFVTQDFRKSVLDREKIGNTNLESGAALPHADPTTVLTSSISMITLKEPINWGDQRVKLVVMITLSEKDILEIREVVQEVYQFVEEKAVVDAIAEIKEKNTLLELFKQEE